MSDVLGAHVSGPTLALASKVKEALERETLSIETEYGIFFVAKVELRWADGRTGQRSCWLRNPR